MRDPRKVLTGAPLKTTGAVATAPVGTELPETAREELGQEWRRSGYVSDDGLTMTKNYSTKDIKDWSQAPVRTILEEFSGEVSLEFIETGYEELCAVFGEDAVERTEATATSGELLRVAVGPSLPPSKAWCFSMKDGASRVRLLVPNGQAVPDGELVFRANDPIKWGCKVSCGQDGDGNCIYILTDDGIYAAGAGNGGE